MRFNRIFLLLIAMLACILQAQSLRNAPAAYYPFSGSAVDSAGFRNHGTAILAVPAEDRHGNPKGAFRFDGRGNVRIPLPRNAPTLFNGDFTLSFWQRSASPVPMTALSAAQVRGGASNFCLSFNRQSGLSLTWKNGAGRAMHAGSIGGFTRGSWQHVSLRRSRKRAGIQLFVDGREVASTDYAFRGPAFAPAGFYLGGDPAAPAGSGWRGDLDDLSMHALALEDSDIALLARDGLLAYYPFNSGPYEEGSGGGGAEVRGPSLAPGHDGRHQSAYHFTGGDSLLLPTLPANLLAGDFTLSYWQKTAGEVQMDALALLQGQGATAFKLVLGFDGYYGFHLKWTQGRERAFLAKTAIHAANEEWHQVVLRRSVARRNIEILLDGTIAGTAAFSPPAGKNPIRLVLGADPAGDEGMGWRGELDELSVHARYVPDGELPTLPYGTRIILASPVGGERWAAGSKHYIAWRAQGGGDVRLEYSRDDGTTWITLEDTVRGVNRWLWTVPDEVGDSCRVRVLSNRSSGAVSASDRPFSIIPTQAEPSYAWTAIHRHPDAPFDAMDGAMGETLNGHMVMMGGWNGSWGNPPTTNNVWTSTDGIGWTLSADPSPWRWERRHSGGQARFDSRLWIIGGDLSSRRYQTDIWWSQDGKAWNLVSDTLFWLNRILHIVQVHDGRMWVMGGQKMGEAQLRTWDPEYGKEAHYNDVWSSRDGRDWSRVLERAPWAARGMIDGNAVHRGRLWILGGGTYDTNRHPYRAYFQDVWSSPDGIAWERIVEQAPWHGRQYHGTAVYDDKLWVVAGYNPFHNVTSNGLDDAWYSSDGVNWYEAPRPPEDNWPARHAPTVFVHEGALWLTGGIYRDVWRLSR